MAMLLGRLATTRAAAAPVTAAPGPRAHLDRLLQAFDRHGLPALPRTRTGAAGVAGLPSPLTARELEVLQLRPPASQIT
jgi:hypothetical protein